MPPNFRPTRPFRTFLRLVMAILGGLACVSKASSGFVPYNDSFAYPQLAKYPEYDPSSDYPFNDNTRASREPGEPMHGPGGAASLWWKWVAPETGDFQISTAIWGVETIDTVLAVYTGDQLNSLMLVAQNDDAAGQQSSTVVFRAVANTVYRIAVDGKNGAKGLFGFELQKHQPNDLFANRQVLPAWGGEFELHSYFATAETGEPQPVWLEEPWSLWWSWTAPVSGNVELRGGSSFAAYAINFVGVFTGNSLAALLPANSDTADRLLNPTDVSFTTFPAVAGTTYQILVAGPAYDQTMGRLSLKILQAPPRISGPAVVGFLENEPFSFEPPIETSENATLEILSPLPSTLSGVDSIMGFLAPGADHEVALQVMNTHGSTQRTLRLVAVAPQSYAAALDTPDLAWSHHGEGQQSWLNQSDVTHDGVDALVAPDRDSGMFTTIQGPAKVSFWLKLDRGHGELETFTVNAGISNPKIISGTRDWEKVEIIVAPGPQELHFSYSGGGQNSSGGAWVDQLVVTPITAPPTLLGPAQATAYLGRAFSVQFLDETGYAEIVADTLPPGFVFIENPPQIHGLPTELGDYQVTLTASSPQGSSTKSITISVLDWKPLHHDALDQPASPDFDITYSEGSRQTAVSKDGVDALELIHNNEDNSNGLDCSIELHGPGEFSYWWRLDTFARGTQLTATWGTEGDRYGNRRTITTCGEWQKETVVLRKERYYFSFSLTNGGFPDLDYPELERAYFDKFEFKRGQSTPVITGPPPQQAWTGVPYFFTVQASEYPTAYSATNLPPGLFITPKGDITGEPTASGSFTSSIAATNSFGTSTSEVTFTVYPYLSRVAEALDQPGLTFSVYTGYGYPVLQTAVSHDGKSALAFDVRGYHVYAGVSVTVTGPVEISFWAKVHEGTPSYEGLTFKANQNHLRRVPSTNEWVRITEVIHEASSQTLRWGYSAGAEDGPVGVWLDEIVLRPITRPYSPASGGDYDGDGSSDAQEQWFGTSLVDPTERPSSTLSLHGDGLQLTFPSVPQRGYVVERSTNLRLWTPLGTAVATGSTTHYLMPLPTVPKEYFRLRKP